MIRIEIVTRDDNFLSLEEEWRELVCQCPDVSYFLTWEYVSTRWKYLNDDRSLCILLARNEEGTLVGIAPWLIAKAKVWPFDIRRLEFICRAEIPHEFEAISDGENLDIIALPEYKDITGSMFYEHLESSQNHWDVADLAWLSSDSSVRNYLVGTRALSIERPTICAFASLPDNWSTYEETVLGKSKSKQIRKQARRLERDYPHQVGYHLITRREEVGPAMDNLIEMNNRRWRLSGQSTAFEDVRHVRSHREFAEAAFDRGWLRFYQLRIGDLVIAANCGLILHGIYYGFQKGFDLDWKRYAPGYVLQVYEIKKAIEEKCHIYDEGLGMIEAKSMWANSERREVRLISRRSWKGILYVGKIASLYRGKAVMRRLLPERVYMRLRNTVVATRRGFTGN